MELGRRDALAALAAVGAGTGVAALSWDALDRADRLDRTERDQLVALAEVVYPSVVGGVPRFVERYVVGRTADRPAYVEGMADALAELDERAVEWRDTPWLDLPPAERDALLREMGVEEAEPDPDGLGHERVRFYLVNELLYALYTTPTGGDLVGIENPIGHPGGTASYRRPPPGAAADDRGGTRDG